MNLLIKLNQWLLVLLFGLGSFSAFAHGPSIDTVNTAVNEVVKLFKNNESKDTVHDFVGVKAWVNGDTVSVKVYLTKTRELLYQCEEDHDTDEFTCKKL